MMLLHIAQDVKRYKIPQSKDRLIENANFPASFPFQ